MPVVSSTEWQIRTDCGSGTWATLRRDTTLSPSPDSAVSCRYMANLENNSLAEFMVETGVPRAFAMEAVEHVNETRKGSILRLYRSAVEVGTEWEPGLAGIRAPGLVFWGVRDKDCPVVFANRLGVDAHAHRVLKPEAGHWVPLEQPTALARGLEEFWQSNK